MGIAIGISSLQPQRPAAEGLQPVQSVASALQVSKRPSNEPETRLPPSPTLPLKVEGVTLDLIPFVGDAAILIDDLPQKQQTPPEPIASPGKSAPEDAAPGQTLDQMPDLSHLGRAAVLAYDRARSVTATAAQTDPAAEDSRPPLPAAPGLRSKPSE